ncbi:prohibitin-2, mitochondrial-like [Vicia villosa]|uniref:prohibitin-2, mitochondrial-like n=1 Tax=Vicia villosa TaxID=3911 RepID=UPI00273A7B0B|nr:prohibitin-2, mitochondrial-like [Vicia villosa]
MGLKVLGLIVCETKQERLLGASCNDNHLSPGSVLEASFSSSSLDESSGCGFHPDSVSFSYSQPEKMEHDGELLDYVVSFNKGSISKILIDIVNQISMAVSREIRKILTERTANFNIALDDVSITTLTFGKEFTAAIEAKQVAAQEAERAKFVVEKAEQDKRSAVIRAQGEAKSAQLIGQAISNNPAFITLRKIEAAREIAHTISNAANKVFLNSDDLLLNLQELNFSPGKN